MKGVFIMKQTTNTSNKHFTFDERCRIEELLNQKESIRQIAAELRKSPSSVSREIARNGTKVRPGMNVCVNKASCSKKHMCDNSKCSKACSFCPRCAKFCEDFEERICEKLAKRKCCNGCINCSSTRCRQRKLIYRAGEAQQKYNKRVTQSREGFDLTGEQLEQLNELISPLIKSGLSPYHISRTLGGIVPSESTIRRLIDAGELDVKNIDLRKKVKMKPRKKRMKKSEYLTLSAQKEGRKYDDFKEFQEDNDFITIEMDCVEGAKSDKKVLLTLYFKEYHFQLAFLLESHTKAAVVKAIDDLEKALDYEVFNAFFGVILTDNGHEFSDIEGLETSCIYTDLKRCKIFFCEPNRPDEKGGCECNHRLIRYVIPKGTSLDKYTQEDITLMMSHINCYTRKACGGKAPYDLMESIVPAFFFKRLGFERIPSGEVNLTPSLLTKE